MKRKNTIPNNPYATNRAGKIEAPKKQSDTPKSTVIRSSGDLRTKK